MAKKNKKQDILQLGFEVMYSKGYHATSVQDITDAAGVPKGSFYHYFKTKELFTLDAVKLYTQLVKQEMEQTLTDTSLDPLERILKLYQDRIAYYDSYAYRLGCFAGNMTQEIADTNETLRVAVDEFFLQSRRLLVQCLQEAQQNGELDIDQDVDEMAEFIVNSYEGSLLRMKSLHSPEPLEIFQKFLTKLLA